LTREERFEHSYLMLLHWLNALYLGHNVRDYFVGEGINTIAIYGMGELANRLIDGLRDSDVEVLYGIDRDPACASGNVDRVYSIDENLPKVDAIIVTPFYVFDQVRDMLTSKICARIISVEEIIWSL